MSHKSTQRVFKEIHHTVSEYDNFAVINGRIYKKDFLAKIAGITSFQNLKYDQLTKDLGPIYYPYDLKKVRNVWKYQSDDWHGYRCVEDKKNPQFPESCWNVPEIKPESKLLADLDDDPSQLYWFNSSDHSLWDWNMKRISVPCYMTYIEAQIHNGKYKLKSLHEYLLKLNKDNFEALEISSIHNIPGYNAEHGRDRTFCVSVCLKQADFDTATAGWKKQGYQPDVHEALAKAGYFYQSDRHEAFKAFMGFGQFEKPEVRDDDD